MPECRPVLANRGLNKNTLNVSFLISEKDGIIICDLYKAGLTFYSVLLCIRSVGEP